MNNSSGALCGYAQGCNMSRAVYLGSLCLLGTALAGGCVTVGPDFQTPEADVADDWLEAEDGGRQTVNLKSTACGPVTPERVLC